MLRILVGQRPATGGASVETLVRLETNIDDMNPEVYDHVIGRLFEVGALIEMVETPYGTVRVKVARWGAGRIKGAPEYEDCRHLAERHGVPLRHIYRAAERCWHGDESVGALKSS